MFYNPLTDEGGEARPLTEGQGLELPHLRASAGDTSVLLADSGDDDLAAREEA